MNKPETLPAPQVDWPPAPRKFDRERQAFARLLPELLATHRGKYVAVHEEKVVGVGDDKLAVANQVWDAYGYQPIYVALVTDERPVPVRIPHYRNAPGTTAS